MLLDQGADAGVREYNQTPLKLAAANGDAVLVERLLTCGADANQMRNISDTALHAAVVHCNDIGNETFVKIVQMLLRSGAEANALNGRGETPLRLVCRRTDDAVNIPIVQTLLEHGADPNICDPFFVDLALWSHEWHDNVLPLSSAAFCSSSELTMLLVEFGARLDHRDNFGRTALHFAIDNDDARRSKSVKKDTSTLEVLLSAGADANVMDSTGASPLYLACERGKTEFVKLLLRRGASPSTGTADKYPIHAACRGHHFDSVKQLLEYNADLTVRDDYGKTALHHALKSASCQFDDESDVLVRLLLDKGADMDAVSYDGETPFYFACSNGLTSAVARMLEYGANVHGNSGKKFPLNAACRSKHASVVQLLLINGADPNVLEESDAYCYEYRCRRTLPLFIAAADGNSELVELLLRHGANVDVTDIDGNTPLYREIEYYHRRVASWKYSGEVTASSNAKSVIDVLLENKADVNIVNNHGETPLYRAASNGMLDVVSKMVQVYGGNPNKVSPLAAACTQNVEFVEMLLKHGADPSARDYHGSYHGSRHDFPLLIAVDAGNSELVELLLKHGANVDVTDTDGHTPLYHAMEHYHQRDTSWDYSDTVVASSDAKSVIDVLLENKADVNICSNSGETPLYRAASRGLLDIVSTMLQVSGGNPNTGSPDKRPLAAACLTQNVELVDVLLKHGADPNVASTSCDLDSYDMPLFIAADTGNSDIILSLLNAGANVNAVNKEGTSAVCLATESLTSSYHYSTEELTKRFSSVRLLLQHGASFSMLMPYGQSPLCLVVGALSLARRLVDGYGTYIELLQLMVNHGAMLLDSSSQLEDDLSRQSFNSATLRALATYDGKHEFITDLLRAGAGFQLIASFCKAVATNHRKAKSICLCQAAVLAGYTPSVEELQNLQLAAARDVVLDQLANWLNEDRQQPTSLHRQCRVAIRRQLSAAVDYQTILPAIDKLPLPNTLKLYLQFDGTATEVDLSVNVDLQTTESNEEGSIDSNSEYFDYMYDFPDYEYSWDSYDSLGIDSDENCWW